MTVAVAWASCATLVMTTAPVAGAAEGPPATAPAQAKSRLRAAILPLAVDGELAEGDRDALLGELVGGLQRGEFDVASPADVLAADAKADGCGERRCYQRVAKATGASHVVRATVVVRDRDYDISVELVDGKSGEVVARNKQGCEICGVVDAGALMASAAATLRTKLDALAQGPSVLSVRSEPDGAEVTVDGELVGVTPLERPIIAGKRVVRVSKEGYIAVEREVTVVEGVAEDIGFELEKMPSRLPKRPWGWVSLGVGIAGVGVAATFAALDDRPFEVGDACTGGNVDARGRCRRLWDTDWIVFGTSLAAATLVTLGVAVLLTSAGKRARAGKHKADRGESRRRARVGVGPGSLVVQGRF